MTPDNRASVLSRKAVCPHAALISDHSTGTVCNLPSLRPLIVPKCPLCHIWNTQLRTFVFLSLSSCSVVYCSWYWTLMRSSLNISIRCWCSLKFFQYACSSTFSFTSLSLCTAISLDIFSRLFSVSSSFDFNNSSSLCIASNSESSSDISDLYVSTSCSNRVANRS